jgi:hypothetical protein
MTHTTNPKPVSADFLLGQMQLCDTQIAMFAALREQLWKAWNITRLAEQKHDAN